MKWKAIAGKILNDPAILTKIETLDLENMTDSEVLEGFVFLNLPELDYNLVSHFSADLGKLIRWCQGVVSYHILIHPYTYRNENCQIVPGSEVHEFAEEMNYLINRFYKFKRFLVNLGITKIPLADDIFNLQHSRTAVKPQEEVPFDSLSYQELGSILSYIPYSVSYKFINVSRTFRKAFIDSVDKVILELVEEIYFFKLHEYETKKKQIPIIYEYHFFNTYFLMLDDILNSTSENYGNNFIPFFTKDQLNDIRNIKKETPTILSIAKIFCLICEVPPERISTTTGEIKLVYIDKIKKLILANKFQKLLRVTNKLYFSEEKLNALAEEIGQFYSSEKLKEVKKINLGIYQLLIWELFVFEYLKNYNPFDFISSDSIFGYYDQEQIESIKYYIEILNYLKYNLKVKYYFSSKLSPVFNFASFVDDLRKRLMDSDKLHEEIFESSNLNLEKVSKVYFESRDLIVIYSKPSLYERILEEIVQLHSNRDFSQPSSINQTANSNQNTNQSSPQKLLTSSGNKCLNHYLGTIKEEQVGNTQPKKGYRGRSRASGKKIKAQKSYFSNGSTSFNALPNDLIIKTILFYLDINSLPIFSLVSKKTNVCVKTHMFIRVYFLGKEKKLIESENSETINSITQKRLDFFNEYEIQPPEISNANRLICQITKDDLIKLKFFYKKYNKKFEYLIAPFVLLLGKKAKTVVKPDGAKNISFFIPAQEMLNQKDIVKKVTNFELETIPTTVYCQVEKILESKDFSEASLSSYSTPHQHMINWVKGIMEFHRLIRKYSLANYDYNYLSESEINFCKEMDSIDILYYRLLRYAGQHCKGYEKAAKRIMSEMNIVDVE